MVNELRVMEALQQLTDLEAEEQTFCDALCRNCLQKVRCRLRPSADPSDPRVISAAAAQAFAALLIRRYSGASSDVSSFKAGDLSITQSSAKKDEKIRLAQALCRQTEEDLLPLLEDHGFFAGKVDL